MLTYATPLLLSLDTLPGRYAEPSIAFSAPLYKRLQCRWRLGFTKGHKWQRVYSRKHQRMSHAAEELWALGDLQVLLWGWTALAGVYT